MTYKEVVKHFGSASKAARALSYSRQAVSDWKKNGRIPFEAQFLIQLKTNGCLKAKAPRRLAQEAA